PFHPYYTAKDLFGLALFLIVFAWFVFYIPYYLLNPDNSIPANPATTPAEIVPEWYLLPFYAILRSIPNKLLGVLALFGSVFVLFSIGTRFGASVAGIVSQRWDWGTAHLNIAGQLTRDMHADLFTGIILEGPHKWTVRPVAEFFYEEEFGQAHTVSALVGAIWQGKDKPPVY